MTQTIPWLVFSASGDRVKDSSCPVLVSTSRELPQHLNVHSNKMWTTDRQPFPAPFSPQETFTEDKMHGFFSVTLTRALCKSVHRKLKKLNVELTSLSEKEETLPSEGLFFHQFVYEVCLKMEPIDVVAHLPTIGRLLSLWSAEDGHSHLADLPPVHPGAALERWSKTSSPITSALHTMPLLHMDIGAVRLFVPVEPLPGNSSQGKLDKGPSSTLLHDFLLLQWSMLHVQPHADNPLPRYPVNREVFHQALQRGMTQQTGSCVEDRQFQLQVKGLSLASGSKLLFYVSFHTCFSLSSLCSHRLFYVHWSSYAWRTRKNRGNWLRNHLWCPNGPLGEGTDDDEPCLESSN